MRACRLGREIHRESAFRVRRQNAAACVGLDEVLADGDRRDHQRRVGDVGEHHRLRQIAPADARGLKIERHPRTDAQRIHAGARAVRRHHVPDDPLELGRNFRGERHRTFSGLLDQTRIGSSGRVPAVHRGECRDGRNELAGRSHVVGVAVEVRDAVCALELPRTYQLVEAREHVADGNDANRRLIADLRNQTLTKRVEVLPGEDRSLIEVAGDRLVPECGVVTLRIDLVRPCLVDEGDGSGARSPGNEIDESLRSREVGPQRRRRSRIGIWLEGQEVPRLARERRRPVCRRAHRDVAGIVLHVNERLRTADVIARGQRYSKARGDVFQAA